MPHKKDPKTQKKERIEDNKLTKPHGEIKLSTQGHLKKFLEKRTSKIVSEQTESKSAERKSENTGSLMVSVSGIRGIIGESLTPEVIAKYTTAFGMWTNSGTIVIGRDSRVSGEMVKAIVSGSLIASGCKVIDIGIAATPTIEIAVKNLKAHGGIAITASHNPIQWNALKLIGPEGKFLSASQLDELLEIARRDVAQLAPWDRLGKIQFYDHAGEDHINRILNLMYLDIEKIRTQKFKVVLDCINGAGGVMVPRLLSELGCESIIINEEPHGIFPRSPEPTVENLKSLEDTVLKHHADIGFAVDPDVDRLALVSEEGKAIGEEWTLAIAAMTVLSRKKGDVVVNASTTMAMDDVCKKFGVTCHRTKIGEINVSTKMESIGAVFGGEGNGGVILPEIHMGRDASTGIALILQFLVDAQKPFSKAIAQIPSYVMKKEKIELRNINADEVLQKIKLENKNYKIDTTDGVKIVFENSWIHFRKSNTEPILRIIAEANSKSEVDSLVNAFTSYFK